MRSITAFDWSTSRSHSFSSTSKHHRTQYAVEVIRSNANDAMQSIWRRAETRIGMCAALVAASRVRRRRCRYSAPLVLDSIRLEIRL